MKEMVITDKLEEGGIEQLKKYIEKECTKLEVSKIRWVEE